MEFRNEIYVAGQEVYLPPRIFPTKEHEMELSRIYELLNMKMGRLEALTGVSEKRVEEKLSISDMATLVAKPLLEKLNKVEEKLTGIIFCGVCKDVLEPSIATIVAGKLGLKAPHGLFTFDISSACTGFLNALMIGSLLIDVGTLKNCLIVTAESSLCSLTTTCCELNTLMDQYQLLSNSCYETYQDPKSFDALANVKKIQKMKEIKATIKKKYVEYSSNFVMGSGAAAYLLTNRESRLNNLSPQNKIPLIKIKGGYATSFGEYADLCIGRAFHLPVETHALPLRAAKIKHMSETFQNCLSTLKWQKQDVDFYIMNQLNRSYANSLIKMMEIDKARVVTNYENYGIIATVAIPLTFSALLARLSGREYAFKFSDADKSNSDYVLQHSLNPKKDTKVIFTGVGGGINYSFIGLELINHSKSLVSRL